jgi:hypothetical protein
MKSKKLLDESTLRDRIEVGFLVSIFLMTLYGVNPL